MTRRLWPRIASKNPRFRSAPPTVGFLLARHADRARCETLGHMAGEAIRPGVRAVEAAVRAAGGTAKGEALREAVGELAARVGRAYCELLALAMVRAPASPDVAAQVTAHVEAAREASEAALGLYYASHRAHGDVATRPAGDLAHDGQRALALCRVLGEYIVRPAAVADVAPEAPAQLPAPEGEGEGEGKRKRKKEGH